MHGEWRYAVAISNVDTEPLSEYEQPLPIRKRDSGLSCQRDTDTHITDTAARVRGEWRHAVAISNADTEPLLECEQPLPIRKRDSGLSCQRDTDTHVTDTAARVRGEWRHAVAMSNVDTDALLECEQPLSIHKGDGAPVVTASDVDTVGLFTEQYRNHHQFVSCW